MLRVAPNNHMGGLRMQLRSGSLRGGGVGGGGGGVRMEPSPVTVHPVHAATSVDRERAQATWTQQLDDTTTLPQGVGQSPNSAVGPLQASADPAESSFIRAFSATDEGSHDSKATPNKPLKPSHLALVADGVDVHGETYADHSQSLEESRQVPPALDTYTYRSQNSQSSPPSLSSNITNSTPPRPSAPERITTIGPVSPTAPKRTHSMQRSPRPPLQWRSASMHQSSVREAQVEIQTAVNDSSLLQQSPRQSSPVNCDEEKSITIQQEQCESRVNHPKSPATSSSPPQISTVNPQIPTLTSTSPTLTSTPSHSTPTDSHSMKDPRRESTSLKSAARDLVQSFMRNLERNMSLQSKRREFMHTLRQYIANLIENATPPEEEQINHSIIAPFLKRPLVSSILDDDPTPEISLSQLAVGEISRKRSEEGVHAIDTSQTIGDAEEVALPVDVFQSSASVLEIASERDKTVQGQDTIIMSQPTESLLEVTELKESQELSPEIIDSSNVKDRLAVENDKVAESSEYSKVDSAATHAIPIAQSEEVAAPVDIEPQPTPVPIHFEEEYEKSLEYAVDSAAKKRALRLYEEVNEMHMNNMGLSNETRPCTLFVLLNSRDEPEFMGFELMGVSKPTVFKIGGTSPVVSEDEIADHRRQNLMPKFWTMELSPLNLFKCCCPYNEMNEAFDAQGKFDIVCKRLGLMELSATSSFKQFQQAPWSFTQPVVGYLNIIFRELVPLYFQLSTGVGSYLFRIGKETPEVSAGTELIGLRSAIECGELKVVGISEYQIWISPADVWRSCMPDDVMTRSNDPLWRFLAAGRRMCKAVAGSAAQFAIEEGTVAIYQALRQP